MFGKSSLLTEDQAKEYIAAYEPQKNMQLEDQMSLIGNTKWYWPF
jgi:hypothetical protein